MATITGTNGRDILTGTSDDDTINGLDAGDFLIGGAGGDVLNGGQGSNSASYEDSPIGLIASLANPALNTGIAAGDTYTSIENLRGGDFNDTLTGNGALNYLEGGLGADSLNGGASVDGVLYFRSPAGLTVDLSNSANNTGEAAGDTFTSIEIIVGSPFNDILRASQTGSLLEGGPGADVFVGGAGGDTVAYWDSQLVFNQTSGVTVNLADPSVNTGEAAGDTYVSIENVTGSLFADVLIGSAGNNFLRGLAGADVLDGGAGSDTADYANSLQIGSSAAVVADLANPANNTGDAAGDVYISIEHLRGSDFSDVLRGDANANFLIGGPGAMHSMELEAPTTQIFSPRRR